MQSSAISGPAPYRAETSNYGSNYYEQANARPAGFSEQAYNFVLSYVGAAVMAKLMAALAYFPADQVSNIASQLMANPYYAYTIIPIAGLSVLGLAGKWYMNSGKKPPITKVEKEIINIRKIANAVRFI